MMSMGGPGRAGRVLLSAVLLASQLLLVAAPATAYDRSANAEVIAHIGGSRLGKVAVSGNYAYAGASGGLVVFDVSDAANPAVAAQVPLPGNVEDIVVAGDFAYVVGDWGEMQIVDITVPTAPVKRGAIGWWSPVHGVAVSGNRAFMTSEGHGLKVVDITEKDDPWLIAYAAPPTGAEYYDVSVVGTKAYVSFGASAAAVNKIRAFNVSDLGGTPVKLGNDYTVPGLGVSVRSLVASGSLVFAAEAARGLEIVDFTTAATPVQRGTYAFAGAGGFDVGFGGALLYLAAGDSGMQVLNVSNPASPALVGNLGGSYTGVTVSGSTAYLTSGPVLTTADVSNPASPGTSGSARLVPADARDVVVSNGYAYVAGGSDGLLKVSVDTTPTRVVGAYDLADANKVAVTGTHAYVGDGATLRAFDVSGDTPSFLKGLPLARAVEGMAIVGNRLYVADGDAGLLVFSIADKANPSLLGSYADSTLEPLTYVPPSGPDGMGPVHAVAADADRVFIGIDGGNVVSLNAANPAAIAEIDRMGTYGDVLSLSLDGDALYAGTSQKVYRIDAADPENVYQVGSYYYFGEPVVSVKGSGPYAYAATDVGFYLIDFSDAANPYIATDFGEGVMAAGGVDVAGDVVYLAARDSGLYALRVPVLRTAGATRYDTAVELSKSNWDSATTVVLATGANFADAACAAPLAHALGGPLLLVHPNGIPQSVLEEIVRLGATNVVIIGSTRAVPASVEASLTGAGIAPGNIKRLAGWNRYDTARLVAHEFKVAKGSDPATAFVATGDNFPDALTVSGIAAALDSPVLLVRKSSVPTPTAAALADLGNPALIAVGSNQVISDAIYNQLGAVGRLSGPTRYETAREVADYGLANGFDASEVIVTSGTNFPDALVSGVVSAKHASPILLTNSGLPDATGDFLYDHRGEIQDVTIVGSAKAVSQAVESQIVETLVQ